MTDEVFLRAIWSRPDDPGPESVYADWLEEQGDARAEFVRARLELRTATGASRAELAQRVALLRPLVPHDWAVFLELPRLTVDVDSWRSESADADAPVVEFAERRLISQTLTFEQGRLIVGALAEGEWPVSFEALGTMGRTDEFRLWVNFRQGDRLDQRLLYSLTRYPLDALRYHPVFDGVLDQAEFEAAAMASPEFPASAEH